MDKRYKMTNTESDIMKFFWEMQEPLTFKETMSLINDRLNKTWKKQTVNTYLCNLHEAKLIIINKQNPRSFLYSAALTKEQYEQYCVRKLVEDTFDNSITNLVSAFTGGKKLSSKDKEELKKLI